MGEHLRLSYAYLCLVRDHQLVNSGSKRDLDAIEIFNKSWSSLYIMYQAGWKKNKSFFFFFVNFEFRAIQRLYQLFIPAITSSLLETIFPSSTRLESENKQSC